MGSTFCNLFLSPIIFPLNPLSLSLLIGLWTILQRSWACVRFLPLVSFGSLSISYSCLIPYTCMKRCASSTRVSLLHGWPLVAEEVINYLLAATFIQAPVCGILLIFVTFFTLLVGLKYRSPIWICVIVCSVFTWNTFSVITIGCVCSMCVDLDLPVV